MVLFFRNIIERFANLKSRTINKQGLCYNIFTHFTSEHNLSGVWWLNVFIIGLQLLPKSFKTYAPTNSKLQHPPHPLQAKPGISAFGDGIVQIPALPGQNSVQMPYAIVAFVCQMPSSAPLVTNKACI